MKVAFDPSLAPLLHSVGSAAERMGAKAWAVGGVVRDALLGHANKDVDVTVEGDVPRLVEALGREWGARFEQYDAFSTATLQRPDGVHVDIVRARSEVYERPGALPTVEPDGIDADLRRRDFTVNAMASDLDPGDFGALVDPLGGERDLRERILRTLHPGSFRDDPTRLFRAARHSVRFGLSPDSMTEETAQNAVRDGALETVSSDRIRREVEITCSEHHWAEMVEWLNRWDVWEAMAGWRPHAAFLRRADVVRAWAKRHLPEPPPEAGGFRFTALLCMAPQRLRPALGARPVEEKLADHARRIAESLNEPDTPDWRRAMDAEEVTAILLALPLVRTDAEKRRLTHYLTQVRSVRPSITGADLLEAGARPGPAIGAALRETVDAVRDGRVRGWEEELAYALRVFHEWEIGNTGTKL